MPFVVKCKNCSEIIYEGRDIVAPEDIAIQIKNCPRCGKELNPSPGFEDIKFSLLQPKKKSTGSENYEKHSRIYYPLVKEWGAKNPSLIRRLKKNQGGTYSLDFDEALADLEDFAQSRGMPLTRSKRKGLKRALELYLSKIELY